MNNDLISRSALKERWTIASPEPYTTDAAEVLASIEEAPTVDAVVPVRCWECVFCREVQGIGREHHWKTCKLLCADVQDEGFCYWGERRADDGT